ncbi:MAG TPA: hypothetical protein VFN83_00350 [Gemmatimonadales bacterium]|jgi:hypothetical protein|nr:hypothetical protein [Gemmatimonadales bacterium]
MCRLTVMLAAVVALTTPVLEAQSASLPPDLNTRVRVWPAHSSAAVAGVVIRFDDSGIGIRTGGDTVLIARDSIRRLEVSRGIHSNFSRGLGRGALIGAGIGAVLGAVTWASEREGDWFQYGPAWIPIGAAGFGMWGGLIGGIAGAASHSEHWDRVRLDQEPARAAPLVTRRDGRTVVGVALRF